VRWPPARPVRAAVTLWLVFAFTVWNVVFDRILVIEGREYVYAAAALVVATVGFAGIGRATRSPQRKSEIRKSEI
jgi:hypothetical protein